MRLPIVFTVLALTAITVPAAHAAEDLDIRGVTLGMTEVQLREMHPETMCDAPDNPVLGDRLCNFRGYGPDPDAFIMVSFVADRAIRLSASFDHSSYSRVSMGLKQKYGDPDLHQVEQLSNAMGAAFDSAKDLWGTPNKSASLVLTERSGKINRSQVVLTDTKAAREAAARMKAGITDNL